MICQATYDSLEAIPESLREEFHQVNGKWQLKDNAIPGVGQLFNSALAANEAKAVGQVKTRNEKIRQLEEELNATKDKLSVLDVPGHRVLSKEDSELFERYTKLGTPKELETKISEHTQTVQKLQRFETTEVLSKIASASGDVKINPEVLSDWATSPEAQGYKFFVKSVEQTDAKGAKTTVEVPYIRIEKKEGDTINVSERELIPFAKESLPEWKFAALTTVTETGGAKELAGGKGSPSGVKLPDLGSTRRAPEAGGEKKRPVDQFNAQRAARPSPFAKAAIVVPGSGVTS